MTTERIPVRSTQFKKDYKLAVRRYGARIGPELAVVVTALCHGEALPARVKDHPLVSWSPPVRECHLRPDLLLVYRVTPDVVELVRLGSHSDIF